MMDPAAELDPRFSDPNAASTGWEETRRILESAELFWICTVRADGRPHITPLVAVWLDEAVYFCTGPGEQKAINLGGNPRVILMTGCNDWQRGIDVVVEGEAVIVAEDRLLERLAQAWRRKWDGRWRFMPHGGVFHHEDGGEALVFSVVPTKVLSFAKGTFGQTRHRPE